MAGEIIKSFVSPAAAIRGLVSDGKYLWISDSGNGKIYKIDKNGNVIFSFTPDDTFMRAIAFNDKYLLLGVVAADYFYLYTLSGLLVRRQESPFSEWVGLTYDGMRLLRSDANLSAAQKIDFNVNVIRQVSFPPSPIRGVAWAGKTVYLFVLVVNLIYQLDLFGNVIRSFAMPISDPGAIAFDGKYLWVGDKTTDRIYMLAV